MLPTIKLEVKKIPYCLIGGDIDEMLVAVKRLPDRKWGEYAGKGNVWILSAPISQVRAALSPLQVLEPGDELIAGELLMIQSARAEIANRESEIWAEWNRLVRFVESYSEKSKSQLKRDAWIEADSLKEALAAAKKPIADLVDSEALAIVRATRLIYVGDIVARSRSPR